MALKDLLATAKTDTVLVGAMERHLLKPSAGSGYVKDERETKVWHPSGLGGCPRQLTLRFLEIPEKEESPNAVKTRIFDVGHHFGYILQEYLYDMGILYGEWKCRTCGHRWIDLFTNPSPRWCPNDKCQNSHYCERTLTTEGEEVKPKLFIWHNLDYLEVPVRNEKYRVAGHADAMIKTMGMFRVVEIKSIKNRDKATSPQSVTFDDLSEPHYAHSLQVQLYTFFLQDEAAKAGETLDDCLVLYMAKNTQMLKEFKLKLMPSIFVEPVLQKMDMMTACISAGIIPDRPEEAVSKSTGSCRWCGHKELCWSIKTNQIEQIRKEI